MNGKQIWNKLMTFVSLEYNYKNTTHNYMPTTEAKILTIPLRISIVALIVGAAFKIMHWPYANVISVSSFASIAILYCFRFGNKKVKNFIDYIKLILVTAWSINGILSTLHLPYKQIFQLITIISFVTWLFTEGRDYFYNNESPVTNIKKKTLTVILILAAIITAIGVFLKIMHWPFGIYFIIAGFGLGIIWFALDSFQDKS